MARSTRASTSSIVARNPTASRPLGGAATFTEYSVPIVGPDKDNCSVCRVQPANANARKVSSRLPRNV